MNTGTSIRQSKTLFTSALFCGKSSAGNAIVYLQKSETTKQSLTSRQRGYLSQNLHIIHMMKILSFQLWMSGIGKDQLILTHKVEICFERALFFVDNFAILLGILTQSLRSLKMKLCSILK